MDDKKQAIDDVLVSLLTVRDEHHLRLETVLTIFETNPEYALSLVFNDPLMRIKVYQTVGDCQEQIGDLLREVEWKIGGVDRFLKLHYRIGGGRQEIVYIVNRLANYPDEFTTGQIRTMYLANVLHPDDDVLVPILANAYNKKISEHAQDIEAGEK